ncbi:hypothetical protein [Crossiella sp. CA198]|uniref:hypothetical protein n=1 Tax=Crossiella sp. CA198 TaxID=3455607 RepID=UPI003F8D8C39
MTGGRALVDHGVLDGIARTLRQTSAEVDGLAGSVPGAPDAGNATAVVTGMLARFLDNAGQLILGAAGAADQVAAGNADYAGTDAQAADEVRGDRNRPR